MQAWSENAPRTWGLALTAIASFMVAALGVVQGLMRGNGAGWTSLYDGSRGLRHPAIFFAVMKG